MLYSCITSSPLALAIPRAVCVASHTAHAEACLSARQNFLATEFPVTPVWPALKSGTAMRTTVKSGTAFAVPAGPSAPPLGLCNYGYVLMIPRAAPSFESV